MGKELWFVKFMNKECDLGFAVLGFLWMGKAIRVCDIQILWIGNEIRVCDIDIVWKIKGIRICDNKILWTNTMN